MMQPSPPHIRVVEVEANNRELVSFQGTSAVGSRTGLRAIYLTPRTIGLSASYRF